MKKNTFWPFGQSRVHDFLLFWFYFEWLLAKIMLQFIVLSHKLSFFKITTLHCAVRNVHIICIAIRDSSLQDSYTMTWTQRQYICIPMSRQKDPTNKVAKWNRGRRHQFRWYLSTSLIAILWIGETAAEFLKKSDTIPKPSGFAKNNLKVWYLTYFYFALPCPFHQKY